MRLKNKVDTKYIPPCGFCQKEQKATYATFSAAASFAFKRGRKRGRLNVYKCRHCHGFHVTSVSNIETGRMEKISKAERYDRL